MKIALFLSAVVAAAPAYAQDKTDLRGDELARMCKAASTIGDPSVVKPEDMAGAMKFSLDAGYCFGYLNGFYAGKSFAMYKNGSLAGKLACVPSNVTIDQLARVLVRTNEEHPEYGNMPAISYVAGSFAKAWPCSTP